MKIYVLNDANWHTFVVQHDDGSYTHDGWPCYGNVIEAMIERGELIEVEENASD